MGKILTIRPPGDKSVTQRALVFGALADGKSVVKSPLISWDTGSMIEALRSLGVDVTLQDGRVTVVGNGRNGLHAPRHNIDCGNSGTTARLLIGVLCGHPFRSRLIGDESLSGRPMRRVTEPLALMGGRFVEEDGDGLPLVIYGGPLGGLAGFESPNSSAQVKTALILAGYVAGVPVSLREPVLSRDHTERMFRALGQRLEIAPGGDLRFQPTSDLHSFEVTVPGDMSSAAFMISAALMADNVELMIEGVGFNPTRTGFLRVIERMGASVEVLSEGEELGEPVADLLIKSSQLRGAMVAAEEVPSLIDEIPILAILAARAEGETTFEGLGELRFKESDRLGMLADNLVGIGVEARAEEDNLTVVGNSSRLSGLIDTHHDHRVAMAFSVLNRLPGVELTLSETASPLVSYPMFYQHLDSVSPKCPTAS